MSSLMKKALERRKQRGLDLTIIIGGPKEEGEKQLPKIGASAPVGEEGEEEIRGLEPILEDQEPDAMAPDMVSDLSDYEKESLMNKKSGSLMERAKQAQLKEKMK